MIYRIKDWSKHFENNRTKELIKMSWVPVPNQHDGDGFTELMEEPDAMALYGAWMLILQVASKCEPRGTLVRDNPAPSCGDPAPSCGAGKRPHDAASIARVTRGHCPTIAKSIPILIRIGWIEVIGFDGKTLQNPAPSCGAEATSGAGSCGSREKGMEGKERKEGNPPEALSAAENSTLEPPSSDPLVPKNGSLFGEPFSKKLEKLDAAVFQKAWNELGDPFSRIVKWTPGRQKAFNARISDHVFLENWRFALSKLSESNFCRGGGSTNWVSDVDFFLSESGFTKVLEGKYDNKASGAANDESNGDFHVLDESGNRISIGR